MVVHNRTLELETFGIQFPKEVFIRFTQNATEPLQRFIEKILKGQPVLLSENWGAVDTAIQQVIQQILYGRFSGQLQKLFLLSKSMELLVLSSRSLQPVGSAEAT